MKIFTLIITGILLLPFSYSNAQTFSFIHNSVSRSYIVHLPPSYSASNLYPLIINMHGYSSNAAQEQGYAEMDAVADTANFIVVYPNGVANSWNSGQTWSYNTGINDVTFISALIDTMSANYSIDASMVYACGMSNGGYMSYRLACELEDKIAAIASVTGVMSDSTYTSCQTGRPIPILHMHGTLDPTVAYNGSPGNTAVETGIDWWVQNNNCPSTPTIRDLPDINSTDASTVTTYYYGPCDNSSEVILFKITGGEHTWPGVSFIIGVTNQDIEGSGEIWLFFRKHKMPGTFNFTVATSTSMTTAGNCDGTATATCTGVTMPYTYSWNTSPVQTNAVATGLCSGFYSLTVYDTNGDSIIVSVLVDEGVLDVEDADPINGIAVYPNPFTNIVTLVNIPSEVEAVQLFDLLGKSLGSFDIMQTNTGEIQLNLSGIAKGSYLLRVEANNSSLHVLLVKQ